MILMPVILGLTDANFFKFVKFDYHWTQADLENGTLCIQNKMILLTGGGPSVEGVTGLQGAAAAGQA